MLLNFPLLIVPVIVYNIFAFTGGGAPELAGTDIWSAPVISVAMVSGVSWTMTVGDLLLLAALVLLFLEILKATRTGPGAIVDHLLSTAVFIACLVQFLLFAEAATSTFFLLMAMTLVDVIAGFSVTIRSARRDFGVGPGVGV